MERQFSETRIKSINAMGNFIVFIALCILGYWIGGSIGFFVGLFLGGMVLLGSRTSTHSPVSISQTQAEKPKKDQTQHPNRYTESGPPEDEAKIYLLIASNLYAWIFSHVNPAAPGAALALTSSIKNDEWIADKGTTIGRIATKISQISGEQLDSPVQAELRLHGLLETIQDQEDHIQAHLAERLDNLLPHIVDHMSPAAYETIELLRKGLAPPTKGLAKQSRSPSSELKPPNNATTGAPGSQLRPLFGSTRRMTPSVQRRQPRGTSSVLSTAAGVAGGILVADAVSAAVHNSTPLDSLNPSAIPPKHPEAFLDQSGAPFHDADGDLNSSIQEEEGLWISEQEFQDESPEEPSLELNPIDQGFQCDPGSAAESDSESSLD